MTTHPKIRGIFERPKGSGDWWIRYHDQHGREHREKVGRRSAAIAAYQKRKTEIREGRFFPGQLCNRVRVTFAQIADDALVYAERHKGQRSAREDRWKMTRLRDWFAGRAAADIRPEEIDACLAELARAGRAPATVNQYRALLSLTFSLAVRAGKVPDNPLRRVPVRRTNNARVRFLTLPEEAALRQAIRRLCPAREPELDLALHTGMRRGEQYTLRWQDVDLERGLITIPRSKHGEKRWLPINSAARRALENLLARRCGQLARPPVAQPLLAVRSGGQDRTLLPAPPAHSLVCHPEEPIPDPREPAGSAIPRHLHPAPTPTAKMSSSPHHIVTSPVPAPSAGNGGEGSALTHPPAPAPTALVCGPRGRRWFDHAIREAGIRDFRYHDLRHTFASRLVMAGVDLRTVQELMGHKTLLMTLRYSHLSQAHTREAIEKLARAAEPTVTGTATGTGTIPSVSRQSVTPSS